MWLFILLLCILCLCLGGYNIFITHRRHSKADMTQSPLLGRAELISHGLRLVSCCMLIIATIGIEFTGENNQGHFKTIEMLSYWAALLSLLPILVHNFNEVKDLDALPPMRAICRKCLWGLFIIMMAFTVLQVAAPQTSDRPADDCSFIVALVFCGANTMTVYALIAYIEGFDGRGAADRTNTAALSSQDIAILTMVTAGNLTIAAISAFTVTGCPVTDVSVIMVRMAVLAVAHTITSVIFTLALPYTRQSAETSFFGQQTAVSSTMPQQGPTGLPPVGWQPASCPGGPTMDGHALATAPMLYLSQRHVI